MPPVHYHHGKFPPSNDEIDWAQLVPLIGPATMALGEFKGLLDAIPNPRVLLSPLTSQEAVLSSRIEGTQATLGAALEYDAGGSKPESEERLLAVSRDNDWTGWSVFFLRGLEQQARANTLKARAIMELYEARKNWIQDKAHSQYSVAIIDFLFSQPIFKATDLGKPQGVPAPTRKRILREIREELLYEIGPASGPRPAIYAYQELLNIAEGEDIFSGS